MNEELLIGRKIGRHLDMGCDHVSQDVARRLQGARFIALEKQKIPAGGLRLASFGFGNVDLIPHLKTFIAISALVIGMMGTYYWNASQDADDNAEVDSALLADDLPVAAYADPGFHKWLEHSSPASP